MSLILTMGLICSVMAIGKKVLVVGLAVLVGMFPVLARVEAGLQVAAVITSQASAPLPQGDELGDKDLVQYEGEAGLLIVLLMELLWGAWWAGRLMS